MATMRHNRNQYRCTFDQWGTKLDGVARTYCEYLIDGDFGTNVCRYLFYFKFFASDNFVLFATGFYDRVHDLKPHQMLKECPSDRAKQALPGRENLRLYMDCELTSKTIHKNPLPWYVAPQRGAPAGTKKPAAGAKIAPQGPQGAAIDPAAPGMSYNRRT